MVYCNEDKCKKNAVYGIKYHEPLKCGLHRIKSMTDVNSKRCEGCEISLNHSFGHEGEKSTHCGKCKKDGMINLSSNKCTVCQKVLASFGLNGKRTHCKNCKTKEMVSSSKKCIVCNIKQPNYGVDKNKPATHCATCKTQEMTTTNKMCFCGKVHPSFALNNNDSPTHCFNCKTDNMVSTLKNNCLKCKKISASYGIDIDKKPTHCTNCKSDDMKRTRKMCEECGQKRPRHGLDKNKPPTHCSSCRKSNMKSFDKLCQVCEEIYPNFGLEGQSATHCKSCKTEEMINVSETKCSTPKCDIRANPKYKGYCLRCFVYTYPNETISHNYKTKETSMVQYIKEKFRDYEWIWDKQISGGKSLRRPDLFLNLKDKALIIECNENKHNAYECICENKRIMELSQDINHKPLVMICFNPDKYIDQNNKSIHSCWSMTKITGMLKIANKNKWDERLNILCDTIQYWIDNNTNKTIEIIELFYDQN